METLLSMRGSVWLFTVLFALPYLWVCQTSQDPSSPIIDQAREVAASSVWCSLLFYSVGMVIVEIYETRKDSLVLPCHGQQRASNYTLAEK